MLTESDIIAATVRQLEAEGYTITQQLTETERGDDIIAIRNGETLRIEAKGNTSSKKSTERYGEPFRRDQVPVHVSKAFHRAAVMMNNCDKAAMALPDNALHREFVEPIGHALDRLKINVYWVGEDGTVRQRHQPC